MLTQLNIIYELTISVPSKISSEGRNKKVYTDLISIPKENIFSALQKIGNMHITKPETTPLLFYTMCTKLSKLLVSNRALVYFLNRFKNILKII